MLDSLEAAPSIRRRGDEDAQPRCTEAGCRLQRRGRKQGEEPVDGGARRAAALLLDRRIPRMHPPDNTRRARRSSAQPAPLLLAAPAPALLLALLLLALGHAPAPTTATVVTLPPTPPVALPGNPLPLGSLLAAVIVPCGVALIALMMVMFAQEEAKLHDDAVYEWGGHYYACAPDARACAAATLCAPCLLVQALESASPPATARASRWRVNMACLLCAPLVGCAYVSDQVSSVNASWGGRRNWEERLYRFLCVLACPCMTAAQLARAERRYRDRHQAVAAAVTPLSSVEQWYFSGPSVGGTRALDARPRRASARAAFYQDDPAALPHDKRVASGFASGVAGLGREQSVPADADELVGPSRTPSPAADAPRQAGPGAGAGGTAAAGAGTAAAKTEEGWEVVMV